MEKISEICNLRILSYTVLNLYILIVGGVIRTKNIKVTLLCNIILSIFVTIGARLMWFIVNGGGNFSGLFELSFTRLKISGVLLGGIVGVILLRKIFPKYKNEITNTIVEATFLGAGITKLECFGMSCCKRFCNTRSMEMVICKSRNSK